MGCLHNVITFTTFQPSLNSSKMGFGSNKVQFIYSQSSNLKHRINHFMQDYTYIPSQHDCPPCHDIWFESRIIAEVCPLCWCVIVIPLLKLYTKKIRWVCRCVLVQYVTHQNCYNWKYYKIFLYVVTKWVGHHVQKLNHNQHSYITLLL